MDLSGTSSTETTQPEPKPSEESRVTPQLVKEVADIIYDKLLHDLKIEEERMGYSKPLFHSKFGGKS